MKHINVLEDALIVGGITISITMIYQILGIVILSFQIILILIKAGIKIYNLVKQKKYKEVEECIDDAKGELENLKGKTDGKH